MHVKINSLYAFSSVGDCEGERVLPIEELISHDNLQCFLSNLCLQLLHTVEATM
jgi:hypothetical protein